jgi:xanthine/CO dehydrogenase XdhC/CoxF family maturation factor
VKKEILRQIIKLKKDNIRLARAFIIQAKSSSPRNTGTEMIITEEAGTYGSIGGGQDEKKVIEKALDLIKKGKSEKLKLTLTRKEAAEIGWVCGGQIDIFIQIIN